MGEHLRILLVDDHLISRTGLAAILGQEPDIDIVGEAENGVTAVELAQLLHPDVVIMDVRMPVMNGIEATRLITSENPETKVIGFTMHSEEDLCAAMHRAGAATCVSKSASVETLIAAIRDCFPA